MFTCDICNYTCNTKQKYTSHLATQKHERNINNLSTLSNNEEINIVSNNEEINTLKQEIIRRSFYCKTCNYTCFKRQNYIKHLATQKHIKQVNSSEYYCETCKYTFYSHQTYIKHLSTNKHISLLSNSKTQFVCSLCNKSYKHKCSLQRHTQTCNEVSLSEENNKLREAVIELSKKVTYQPVQNIINTTTNNIINNKTLNLQIFLNETCKDALNIGEFIDGIKISLKDLESIGDNGFVKGITNIIVQNLANLDETRRPVHCSDVKRETLYVKDNDEWGKEQIGHPKMSNAVSRISSKSIRQLKPWCDANPGFNDASSSVSDTYQTIVRETCETDDTVNAKIVRHVAKNVFIKGTRPT
jgi:hypothetical protein